MIGRLVGSTFIFWRTLCVNETCASVHNKDYVSTNFKVCLGSISILLKKYYFLPSRCTITSKQIDGPPFVKQLSKTNDPYSRKVMDQGKHLDSMGCLRVPKLVSPMEIQKTHGLLIPLMPHTLHRKYSLASPLLASFS